MTADGIGEFRAVSRAGSFTGAARSLDVSVPHVSRQVQRLEAKLGVVLFQRTTRSVRLTDAGQRLRQHCERISQDLDLALDEVRFGQVTLSGRVRVAAPTGSFENGFMAEARVSVACDHPDIELDGEFSPRWVDIVNDGYDLAIRADTSDRAGLTFHPLVARRRVAAASPKYLKEHGIPQKPADLRDHVCIKTHTNTWSFTENGRRREVAIHGRLRVNSGAAIRAACEAGLGVAYMVEDGFDDSISSGRVVPVLEEFWRDDAVIYAVHPETEHLPSRVSALLEHLKRAAQH